MYINKEITKYKKIEKILTKYYIDTPKQLENSLIKLDCLELKSLREGARKRTLHALDVLNNYQNRTGKKYSIRRTDETEKLHHLWEKSLEEDLKKLKKIKLY